MSFFGRYCCCGAILVHIVTGIAAYHFDVDNVILYEDVARNESFHRRTYFGYSVALLNTSSENSSIFIGAPRANSISYKNVAEPGTFFKCEISKPCKEWLIERFPDATPQNGSWLGGSINIGKVDDTDIVLVCAPRWIDTNYPFWLMRGMCYQATATNCDDAQCADGENLEPLRNGPALYDEKTLYFAMGVSGFSTQIILTDPSYLQYVMGCPGVWLSHGTPIFSTYDGIERSFIIPNPRKDSSVRHSAYSGYAVTSGFYFGPSSRVYVTGAPRGANIYGKVILFHFPESEGKPVEDEGIIQIGKNIIGDQIGEYFGSALASCDIDGDGSDDLLVGAPQWSKNLDEGRIYIFRGSTVENSVTFKDRQFINGETSEGRFGSAITCLGDIDYDGYADVAVGAPYDGSGAVYIYHGSKDGLHRTQKIFAPKDTKGFGISISEPKDIDKNGYADIAVGAYLSGHVALFRSKRVVTTAVTLTSGLFGERLRRDADSFLVIVCSSYTGKYPPQELNVTKKLEIEDIYHRAEINIAGNLLSTYEFNDTIRNLNTSCQNFTITIKKPNEYFLEPLKLSVTQRLTTNNINGTLLVKEYVTGIEHFSNSAAVMNKAHEEVQFSLDVPFALDCGNSTNCNSNLSIHMMTDLQNVSHYVIGSTSFIKLNIEVTNTGDQAYRAQAVVSIPMFIRLHSKPPMCTTVEMGNIIICDLDNPLSKNKTKNVSLELDVSNVPRNIEQFYLNATTKTESTDAASGNHATSLLINCVAKTDIGIAGKADENSYPYTLKGEEEQLQSITFQHTYEIKNYEVTPIVKALLSVSIPTHLIHGGNEIELVKVNNTIGKLDGREFHCMDAKINMDIATSSYDPFTITKRFNGNNNSLRSVPKTEKNSTINSGTTFHMSLDNRTLYINCTNPSFKWKTINCELGSFKSAQSVAKLVLAFDLLLPNFTPEIIKKKDIILFVTNASVSITQTVNNRPDSILVGTMFIGILPEYRLPPWLIPLSVFIGVLLLIIVILGLFKCGFFKRTKKIELEALLKDTDTMTPKVFLETTSSREALDIK